DRNDFVCAGCGCVDSAELRNGQHPVHLADVRDSLQHPLRLRIEDDYGAVAEMRNEQQVTPRVEAFVVEACRIAAEGNVGNRLKESVRGRGGTTHRGT